MGRESLLPGRVVLLTGEGQLTAAMARSLRSHGARVALAAPEGELARLAEPPELPDLSVPWGRYDLAEPGRAVDAVIDRFGRLDHVVSVIGARPHRGPLIELDPLALRGVLDRALVLPLASAQRAYWRWMAAHGGSVVHVAVPEAGLGGPQDAALSGLTGLTEWLAAELAPRVDVHTVVPSLSLTPADYQAMLVDLLGDLLTRRTNPAHGPVLVLNEECPCPQRAA
ncbi:SDR family oxidoreductase [Streptomyces sp. NPDC052013]|uniref:SDR family oxidoreductase n=1 Tax=Streptomyces sp. NPDC052013 TaxID=3365679 RepID=UPI0037D080DE